MSTAAPPLLTPDWPAPANVRALCTLRGSGPTDGASAAPREFFNLGDHVGDAPAAVAANRARLRRAMGARPVFLNQVHGTDVAALDGDAPDGLRADAAVTRAAGIACTVLVADCLPVLLADSGGAVVAAAHAGWRGLAGGVLERTLARMKPADAAGSMLAWLGPCIGPQVYEVGDDVRAAFVAADAGAGACFQPLGAGKFLADLPALARRRLAARGVTRVYGNDGGADWCTLTRRERFFSYRRDEAALGGSGRLAACVWRA